MKHFYSTLAAIVLAAIFGFCAGFGVGAAGRPDDTLPDSALQTALANLQPGDTLVLDIHDFRQAESVDGATTGGSAHEIAVSDDAWYTRAMSWFGQGAVEGATQRQGVSLDAEGNIIAGTNKGTGALERFWSWLKSVFWVGAFALIGLLVLTIIPATSGIAGKILRFLGGFLGPIGVGIENIVHRVRETKSRTAFVTAVEATTLTLDQRAAVIAAYDNA